MEAVRLTHFTASRRECNQYVELKRNARSVRVLRFVWRMLPRNGGRVLFLLCPYAGSSLIQGGRRIRGTAYTNYARGGQRMIVPTASLGCLGRS